MRTTKRDTKKRIATALVLLLSLTVRAQVFMMDGDDNYREPEDPGVFIVNPAGYGEGTDSYIPLGNGLWVLGALGGAYLMGKAKNKKNRKKQ